MAFRALLVIADIGGYTRFMRVHRINLAHAQYIVGRLLEATIDAAGARWKLAKLEGDAAFFYARLPENGALDGARLRDQLVAIRRAFHDRRERLVAERMCSCLPRLQPPRRDHGSPGAGRAAAGGGRGVAQRALCQARMPSNGWMSDSQRGGRLPESASATSM